MKISVIQTQRKFKYEPLSPGTAGKEECLHYSRLEIEEGFEMMERAGSQGAQLIVTIEGFNESVSPRDPRYDIRDFVEPLDGPLINRFGKLAKTHSAYVVAGLYTGREDKAYNSAVLFAPDGSIRGIYDKVHMPYNDDRSFASGDHYPVFETEFGNVAMLICWDMQFPEPVREVALAGADLIACPTQGWEPIYGPCRAYENGVSLAVAMYVPYGRDLWDDCDPSCIIDNRGKVVAAASRRGSDIASADIDLKQEPPPQYGAEQFTGMRSMREIRMSQRRPDTYRLIARDNPPILARYANKTPKV
ncbi:MAG: carbon-nitrogen hydrolase family protein [Candidatus Hydrogenedentales bacterium]|jgi:predicted amidohydrolase